MSDRGKDTTKALTEIRTVLSRAETALAAILCNPENEPGDWVFDQPSGRYRLDGSEILTGRWVASGPATFDPDYKDMADVLTDFIDRAKRWERTGRSPRV